MVVLPAHVFSMAPQQFFAFFASRKDPGCASAMQAAGMAASSRARFSLSISIFNVSMSMTRYQDENKSGRKRWSLWRTSSLFTGVRADVRRSHGGWHRRRHTGLFSPGFFSRPAGCGNQV
jgi:hypothetical protein